MCNYRYLVHYLVNIAWLLMFNLADLRTSVVARSTQHTDCDGILLCSILRYKPDCELYVVPYDIASILLPGTSSTGPQLYRGFILR